METALSNQRAQFFDYIMHVTIFLLIIYIHRCVQYPKRLSLHKAGVRVQRSFLVWDSMEQTELRASLEGTTVAAWHDRLVLYMSQD